MKNKLLWVGSVIILILSVICFVVFGVGTEIIRALTGNGSNLEFGKYDGKSIELTPGSEFANAVSNYTNYYQNQGAQLDDSAYFYIYNYAFNSAVQAMAYKTEVAKSGYEPSKKAISRQMLPYFSDENGNYDPKLYNQVSESDKNSLRNDIKRSLTWTRFSEDMFGSNAEIGGKKLFGLKSSAKETEFLADLGSKKKSFDMVAFNKDNYPESEVKAFAEANKDLFTKYDLSAVTFEDETAAKKAAIQIQNNEVTFEDAISELSKKTYTDNDGKVTANYLYQLKNSVKNADDVTKITGLAKDALSEVIEMSNGYAIFRLNNEKEEADLNDSAVVSIVKEYISSNESGKIEDYYIETAKNFAASALTDGFDTAAKAAKVSKIEVPAFALNYGDSSMLSKLPSDISELSGASTNENFLEKAFALKLNEISEPIVLGNYVVVLKVTGEQTDKADDSVVSTVKTESASYDQSGAQSALLASKKVENNVSTVYFNNFLKRN